MSYVENNFSQITVCLSLTEENCRILLETLFLKLPEWELIALLPLFIAIHSSAGFPSLGSADILDPIPCCGGCPVSWVLFSSVPGLCPVDAVSTPTKVLITKMSPNWEPVLKGKAKLLYQKKPNQMQWLKKDRIFSYVTVQGQAAMLMASLGNPDSFQHGVYSQKRSPSSLWSKLGWRRAGKERGRKFSLLSGAHATSAHISLVVTSSPGHI